MTCSCPRLRFDLRGELSKYAGVEYIRHRLRGQTHRGMDKSGAIVSVLKCPPRKRTFLAFVCTFQLFPTQNQVAVKAQSSVGLPSFDLTAADNEALELRRYKPRY